MSRTARALPAAAVLAAAALVISGPVAFAHPGAGAGRNTVRPGGTLAVPVPCDALTGALPGIPGAADGQPCGAGQEPGQGPQLAPEHDQMLDPPEAAGETGQAPQSAREPSGQGQPPGPSQQPGAGQHTGQGQGQGQGLGQGQQSGQGQGQGQGQGKGQGQGQDEGGRQCAEGSHGCSGGSGGTGQCHDGQKCPAGDGDDDSGQCRDGGGRCHGSGQECGAAQGASCPGGHTCRGSRDDDCGPPAVQGGVQAGQGGTFTDSVPALAAGGALIAAACGGAGYRLHGRRPRRRVSG
ncbi:hypothetical protein AQJ66_03855 [Streptomyces bungoensis]|uniref:Uncharacterized protein n=1 Tax=Streptomyces bungoensis TaxID=285568 RepID=A0A101TC82_9ACTN|nr:hypothetical protein AQJ66_03855 [Streptomyces bungoensis]